MAVDRSRTRTEHAVVPADVGTADVGTVELLAILERIAWDANSHLDGQSLLSRIVRSVAEHSPWSICWAGLFDLDADRLILWADSGLWRERSEEPFNDWPLAGSPSVLAVEQGAPLTIPDVAEAVEFPRVRDDGQRRGFRSALIVPLRVRNDSGALWVCGTQAHHFTDAEIAVATVIASLAAIALNNAQLLQTERRLLENQRYQLDELARLHQVMTTQNHALQRRDQIHERLVGAVLNDQGIPALIDTVAALASAEVIIVDQFSDLIVASSDCEYSFLSALQAELVASRQRDSDSVTPRRHIARDVILDSKPWVIAPIVATGLLLGHIAIADAGGNPTELRMLAEQVCPLLAIELYKERIRLEADLRTQREFTEVLATADPDSDRAIRLRASLLNINVGRTNIVCRIQCSSGRPGGSAEPRLETDQLGYMARAISQRIQSQHPAATVIPLTTDDWVAIFPAPGGAGQRNHSHITEPLRRAFREVLPSDAATKIAIGIGEAAKGADGLRRSFDQARLANEILALLHRPDDDLPFTAAGSYTVLLSIPTSEQSAFVERLIGPLRDYDREHHSELIHTLRTYLHCLGSMSQTAQALYLHVTTVRYRLQRIEAVVGASLDNDETRLSLQLALHLDQIRNGAEGSGEQDEVDSA
jgi:sugar diacid utilization regulator